MSGTISISILLAASTFAATCIPLKPNEENELDVTAQVGQGVETELFELVSDEDFHG